MIFIVFVVRKFSTLELKNDKNEPQIRILREISSIEPAPKVWKPKSRSKSLGFYFLSRKYKVGVQGFLVFSEVPELYRKLREPCGKNFLQLFVQIQGNHSFCAQKLMVVTNKKTNVKIKTLVVDFPWTI